jgi:hypothetical protein
MSDDWKDDQDEVSYRDGHIGQGAFCLTCRNYVPPSSCSRVRGMITPRKLCNHFDYRGGSNTPT